MFGNRSEPETPHRSIEVETADTTDTYEFTDGGQEVSFKFEDDRLVVAKSDGLRAIYVLRNIIRIEELLA